MTPRPHDFGPAILNVLRRRPMALATLIDHLGAQDAWDRVKRKLQQYRIGGVIVYFEKKWQLTYRGGE